MFYIILKCFTRQTSFSEDVERLQRGETSKKSILARVLDLLYISPFSERMMAILRPKLLYLEDKSILQLLPTRIHSIGKWFRAISTVCGRCCELTTLWNFKDGAILRNQLNFNFLLVLRARPTLDSWELLKKWRYSHGISWKYKTPYQLQDGLHFGTFVTWVL